MTHLSEADLFELHFLSDQTSTAGRHVRECSRCAARLDQLRGEVRDAAEAALASIDTKPDSFWVRQRLAINRSVMATADVPQRSRSVAMWRWTAAAALTLCLSAAVVYRTIPSRIAAVAPVHAATSQQNVATAPADDLFRDLREINDPWNSDSLKPFQGAVQWESWTGAGETDGDETL